MNRLLIVDDEQIVTDSVQFIVGKFMNRSIQTETAHSGREAIEKAASFRPDIVMIDIKMPGISGLDAIREMKRIYSGALFIIISAFAKFDYAKEAIELGVIEYLNKPLSQANLISALNHAIEKKREEQGRLKAELDYKEKMAFLKPALENSFIYDVILFSHHTSEMESLKRILDLQEDGGYIMTVEIGEEKGGFSHPADSGILSRKIYPLVREAIKETGESIVGPLIVNRVVAYVSCKAYQEDSSGKSEALNHGTRLYQKLQRIDASRKFSIGIGKCYPSLQDSYKSYRESIKSIDYESESGVIHVSDIPVERGLKRAYPKDAEKTILKKIELGETDAGLLTFEYLFGWLKEQYGDNTDEIKSCLIELVVLIFGIPKSCHVQDDKLSHNSYIKEFMAIRDLGSVDSWMKETIRRISDAVSELREKKLPVVIKSAIDYMVRNYNSNITLEDVSGAVNVSPTYFSKLFREEVGSTFIDYLTMLRIQQAKKLIGEGNFGNKEICDVIGYSDPNYFSRVFKKTVGITPTEYRSSFSHD